MLPTDNAPSIKQQERLRFIDQHLFWHQEISRNDLTDKFGLSGAQSTLDLKAYQEQAPGNIQYDVKAKRYVPTKSFEPKLFSPDAREYLTQLLHDSDTLNSETPALKAETLPTLYRKIDLAILRVLVRALGKKSAISIGYQSPYNAECTLRVVQPLVFVYALNRWHLRAYCYQKEDFRSFVLGRILKAEPAKSPDEEMPLDRHWHEMVEFIYRPSGDLSEQGKAGVLEDFGMKNGEAKTSVRRALLKYFLAENHFTKNPRPEPGEDLELAEDNGFVSLVNFDQIRDELQLLKETRKA